MVWKMKKVNKSIYLTKLWLEHLDGNIWIICAPFRYWSHHLGTIIVIPIETEIDLASIPYPFRMIWPKSGKYNPAAALHDAGYRNKLRFENGTYANLSESNCNTIFNEAMELSGVNGFQRRVMYRMVSWFGRKSNE